MNGVSKGSELCAVAPPRWPSPRALFSMHTMLRIGDLELGMVPRVAVPLTDREVRAHGAAAKAQADIFELRIDQFAQHDPAYVAEVCREASMHGVPLIATVRAASEGGAVALGEAQRLAIFEAVAPLVDALDIENHAPIRDQVIALAQGVGRLVIVSHHDFDGPATAADMVAVIDAAKLVGADIVKLALTAHNVADLDHMLAVLRDHRRQQLILIAMGDHGVASRVFFPLIGSLITYGYLHQAVAPGQLSLADLTAELRRYSPEYARQGLPR